MALDLETKVVLRLAHRLIDIVTEPGMIPQKSGDLFKSIDAKLIAPGKASIGSSLIYARAVHDGRPPITIKPNISKNPPYGHRKHRNPKKARLKFTLGGQTVFARSVRQKARKSNPFLHRATIRLKNEIAIINAGGSGPLMGMNRNIKNHYEAKLMRGVLKRVVIDV